MVGIVEFAVVVLPDAVGTAVQPLVGVPCGAGKGDVVLVADHVVILGLYAARPDLITEAVELAVVSIVVHHVHDGGLHTVGGSHELIPLGRGGIAAVLLVVEVGGAELVVIVARQGRGDGDALLFGYGPLLKVDVIVGLERLQLGLVELRQVGEIMLKEPGSQGQFGVDPLLLGVDVGVGNEPNAVGLIDVIGVCLDARVLSDDTGHSEGLSQDGDLIPDCHVGVALSIGKLTLTDDILQSHLGSGDQGHPEVVVQDFFGHHEAVDVVEQLVRFHHADDAEIGVASYAMENHAVIAAGDHTDQIGVLVDIACRRGFQQFIRQSSGDEDVRGALLEGSLPRHHGQPLGVSHVDHLAVCTHRDRLGGHEGGGAEEQGLGIIQGVTSDDTGKIHAVIPHPPKHLPIVRGGVQRNIEHMLVMVAAEVGIGADACPEGGGHEHQDGGHEEQADTEELFPSLLLGREIFPPGVFQGIPPVVQTAIVLALHGGELGHIQLMAVDAPLLGGLSLVEHTLHELDLTALVQYLDGGITRFQVELTAYVDHLQGDGVGRLAVVFQVHPRGGSLGLWKLAQVDVILIALDIAVGTLVCAIGVDVSIYDLNDAVAVEVYQIGLVGDQQDQVGTGYFLENIHDQDGIGLVQVTRGLVGQNDGRVLDQSAGDGHPLLLTARKGVGSAVTVFGHIHVGKGGHGALGDGGLVGHAAETEGGRNVLIDGLTQVEVIVLEDVADILIPQGIGILADISAE